LRLLDGELLLAGQEVLQGIGPKADKQLIQASLERIRIQLIDFSLASR
jgi:hypothetical protein